jgi:hypothetical protein
MLRRERKIILESLIFTPHTKIVGGQPRFTIFHQFSTIAESLPPVLQAVHIFIPSNLFFFRDKVKAFLEVRANPQINPALADNIWACVGCD